MTFHDNLRNYRKQLGITAKDFANMLDMKYTTYIAYENQGREPSCDTLCKIADKLNISTDELLGRNIIPKTKEDDWISILKKCGYSFNELDSMMVMSEDGETLLAISKKELAHDLENIVQDINEQLQPSFDFMLKKHMKKYIDYKITVWRYNNEK